MWQERLANGKFCVVLDIEEWRAGIRTTVTYNRGQPKQLIIHDEINHVIFPFSSEKNVDVFKYHLEDALGPKNSRPSDPKEHEKWRHHVKANKKSIIA